MAEDLVIAKGTKKEQYESLFPQVEALLAGETDFIACLANFAAALKSQFHFFWIGFYLVKGEELVLGPFQGPVACTRISLGRGVCGTAWQRKETVIVADVNEFPGHIACSSASQSEIVVPLFQGEQVIGVLDVDSEELASFDEVDAQYLAKFLTLLPVAQDRI